MSAIVVYGVFGYLVAFMVLQTIFQLCYPGFDRDRLQTNRIRLVPGSVLGKMVMIGVLPWSLSYGGPLRLVWPAAQYAGLGLIVVGLLVSMWGQIALGHNWIGGVGVLEGHHLITSGPYAYVRNPMYTGMFVSGAGCCLLSLNAFVAVGMAGLCLGMSCRVPGEELLLRNYFHERYERYAQATPRYWPRLRRR